MGWGSGRLSARLAPVLAVTAVVAAACSGASGTGPSEKAPSQANLGPGHPYPYDRPAPAARPTALDGTFTRRVTVAQIGAEPVTCRRCAPYRLDAGMYRLRLDRGEYHILFRPIATARPCADCKLPPPFSANGHFEVDGDRLTLFNDANCIGTEGTYRWSLDGGVLLLEAMNDPCPFGGLRRRFLTTYPWQERT